MKYIQLTQGKRAVVDDDMYDYLTCWDWHYGNGYARRAGWSEGEGKIVKMHHVVLPLKKGFEVDHINGDSLDNRRKNLRLVTRTQNSVNKRTQRNSTSGFKGVNRHQGKWRAYICKDKKQIHLGVFDRKEDAAQAYDDAAGRLFGEYACLNLV
jgi:hypothetical protein